MINDKIKFHHILILGLTLIVLGIASLYAFTSKTVSFNPTFVDQSGHTVSLQKWHGKFLIIFFGYTECPDICPTTLHTLGEALRRLSKEDLDQFQPIFITLDPDKDTPEILAAYTSSFHPKIIGLTGDAANLEKAAAAFGIYHEKVIENKEKPDEYSIDHDSAIFILGKDGKLMDTMLPTVSPDLMAERLRNYISPSPHHL